MEKISPLTSSQMGVYFESFQNPDSKMYNISKVYKFGKTIDGKRLCHAVKKACSNYEVFADTIRCIDGVFYNVVDEEKRESFINERVNYHSVKDEEMEQILKNYTHNFKMENSPLYYFDIYESEKAIYLLSDLHHTILDGTSGTIFFNGVKAAYEGNEIPKELTSLKELFEDEKKLKENGTKEKDFEFYEKLLDGHEAEGILYGDKDNFSSSRKSKEYTKKFSLNEKDLLDFTKQNGMSENALLINAFSYLLSKYSSSNEAIFSTVTAGRRSEEYKSVIGMTVRTFPFYAKYDEEENITELIKNQNEIYKNSLKHSNVDFSRLVNELNYRSEITFVYQGELWDNFEIDGTKSDIDRIDTGYGICDLTCYVFKQDGKYISKIEYNIEKYSETFISAFLNAYERIVSQFTQKKMLKEVEFVNQENLELFKTFRGKTSAPKTSSVLNLIKEQIKNHPGNTALVFNEKHISYGELDSATKILAAKISSYGIKKENFVSVLIHRSHFMPLCSIGVLRTGAAYQPLDPSYPKERLNYMMKDSGAKLLICDRDLRDLVDEYQGQVIFTDEIESLIQKSDISSLENYSDAEASGKDAFVILYTSGTTGVPKGVILDHNNIVSTISFQIRNFSMDENTKYAAYASYGFDANLMDMYTVLSSGGELHILDEELRLDLSAIDEYFIKNKINFSFMTTQVGRAFAEMTECKTLKYLLTGGEKLVPLEYRGNFDFVNIYGPTECSIYVTHCKISSGQKNIPIGKPNDNLEMYIVDKYNRLLPYGARGELCVSGPQVGRGYLNLPEKTAAAFVTNPFRKDNLYETMYKTGDICSWLETGDIAIAGRNDGQVKVRGFRIELTEVEKVIRDFADIKDATVIALDNPAGGKMLAAYIVSDKKIERKALESFILETKPPYMVPSSIMQIEKIPLNVNSKVDKRKLPPPVFEEEKIVPPSTEMQKKICGAVSELLGIPEDKISIEASLLSYGLTSISMLKLNVLLSKLFDLPLKTSDLKDNNTVLLIEKLLQSKKKSTSFAKQKDYPLTMTQMGIYVETSANPDTTVYNIPMCFKLDASLEPEKIKAALEKTIDAHPYLKTRLFSDTDGEIRARRNDDAMPLVELVHCDTLPKENKLVKPYNLLKENLYRAIIFCTKEGNYLFLETHHIVSDGESLAILLQELDQAYSGKELATESYTGYEIALEEEAERQTIKLKKAEDYYASVFEGCDTDCLITKNVDECDIKGNYGLFETESSTDFSQVKAFTEKSKVSLNAFYLSCFGYLLSKYLYREDSVFTTIYNGRSDARTTGTVDMLVKTLPVYVNIEKEDDIASLCRTTQAQFLESMTNDLFSFAELSRKFGIKADIQFIFQGDLFDFDSVCGKKAERIPLHLNAAKTPMDIKVYVSKGKVKYKAEYRADFYDQDFIRLLLENLDSAVKEFCTKQKLSEISLMSEKALAVYEKLNDTDLDFDVVSVNKLFEKQAEKFPEKTAVVANKESLTFGELNTFANRVSHELIKRGVRKDTIVGMVFDRTKEIFIAEQGILKSGAAFLPMVEEYPDERISFCLKDAASTFVLTTKKIKEERKELFDSAKPCEVLTIEELIEERGDPSFDNNPNLNIPVDSLAYCIYTSGSTGKPKGVMLEHRNLFNYISATERNISTRGLIKGINTALSVTSIAFDMSLNERFVALCNGITLVMASLDEIHNPLQLNSLMLEHKVETIVCTPSFLSSLYDFEELHDALRNLKGSHIGGENLPEALVNKMKSLNPNFCFTNGYGPTEACVAPVGYEAETKRRVLIGEPGPNVKCFVVDKKLNLLPSGIQGELLICGQGVGRGYVNLPDKTEAAFIKYRGFNAYHSGDKVRITTKGKLECFGRLDNQVKLRGLRIELDEIENVIISYGHIRLVKVIVRNNGTEDYLAGFFTADSQIDVNALKEYLATKLTPYMIPDVLLQLEKMPLNTNGKIDKKALPETTVQTSEAEYVAPENEREKFFCEVFEKVLKRDKVGATDNFFRIGGTSLSATRVVSFGIQKGYNLVYKNVFKNPTPRLLSQFVQEENGNTGAKEILEKTNPVKTEIRPSLRGNTFEHLDEISYTPLGNVLLTGCTGFLGIHVLRELIKDSGRKVFCLMRKGDSASLENRLKILYFYYFAENIIPFINEKVFLIEGDITDANLYDKVKAFDFSEIINCAACVKHFAVDDSIAKVNYHGVENLIELTLKKNSKLIQVSTTSVAGEGGPEFDETFRMTEFMCDFGQIHENQYVDSKLKAELAILDAIETKKLHAKIIRVGNLSSRWKDGEFQINAQTNGFMSRLKAYKILGAFPVEMLDSEVEFSPIDYVAKSLLLLSGTPDEFTVFNNKNCHTVHMANIIEACNNFGMKVKIVKQKEFDSILAASLENEDKTVQVSSLLSYKNNEGKSRHSIASDSRFTIKALYRLGFSWSLTGQVYMNKFLSALEMLDFFTD